MVRNFVHRIRNFFPWNSQFCASNLRGKLGIFLHIKICVGDIFDTCYRVCEIKYCTYVTTATNLPISINIQRHFQLDFVMSHFLLMRLQKNTFSEKEIRIKMQRDSFVWFLKEKLHFEVVLTFLSEFLTCEHENCDVFNK